MLLKNNNNNRPLQPDAEAPQRHAAGAPLEAASSAEAADRSQARERRAAPLPSQSGARPAKGVGPVDHDQTATGALRGTGSRGVPRVTEKIAGGQARAQEACQAAQDTAVLAEVEPEIELRESLYVVIVEHKIHASLCKTYFVFS